ncbi:hypothetical protein NW766_011821 [Fusarium irregulare]|uniref:Uncharacterized protein n=1 Tax=Fusarium irregulare TaxID=2494466 RepID=A0A9W8U409_9HYPO|nr:hypothetical protein NW766_011821 [Fusarium irregulare]
MRDDSIDVYEKLGSADEEGSPGTQGLQITHDGSGTLALANNASVSFDRLRDLAGGFEAKLRRSPGREALTNQVILKAIRDVREATLHLCDYQKAMQSLNEEGIAKWSGKASGHQKAAIKAGLITIGSATLAALTLVQIPPARVLADVVTAGPSLSGVPPNAVAPTAGVVGTVISGRFTYGQYTEMSKSRAILNNVKKAAIDGRAALRDFLEALRRIQAALASDYMKHVMGFPLECMGDHELEQAFKSLGADLQFLGTDKYRDTLVKERIEELLEASKPLQDAYQATMDAINVVTDTVGVVEESSEYESG